MVGDGDSGSRDLGGDGIMGPTGSSVILGEDRRETVADATVGPEGSLGSVAGACQGNATGRDRAVAADFSCGREAPFGIGWGACGGRTIEASTPLGNGWFERWLAR